MSSVRDRAGQDQLLNQILSIPGNERCCDCSAENPEWASINLGITLCICNFILWNILNILKTFKNVYFLQPVPVFIAVLEFIWARFDRSNGTSGMRRLLKWWCRWEIHSSTASMNRSWASSKTWYDRSLMRTKVCATCGFKPSMLRNSSSIVSGRRKKSFPNMKVTTWHQTWLCILNFLLKCYPDTIDANWLICKGSEAGNIEWISRALALNGDRNFCHGNDLNRAPIHLAALSVRCNIFLNFLHSFSSL